MMEPLRIIFMGTPEFAAGILQHLLTHQYNVIAVITAADKPAGRGQKVKYSAVKEFALERNLTLLQPTNLKDEDFLAELTALNANLQIVVAFRMLPEAVWKMPKYGTFNLHASLLPDYRGAAPINWAILNGEKKTGVTTFFIDDKIDTGAMILSAEVPINPDENVGELHDKLLVLGANVVVDTLQLIESGDVPTKIQRESADLKTAVKLTKENCKIDWTRSGTEIYNQIRGLSPYPGAWTTFIDGDKEWIIKIYEATFILEDHSFSTGKLQASKKELQVAVKGGFINIKELQFPGKKKMKTGELMNGLNISENANAC